MKAALSTWGATAQALSTWGAAAQALQHPPEGQQLSLLTLELIVRDLLLSQDHAIVPGQQQSHAQQENLHGVASLESGVLERTAEHHGNRWAAYRFSASCYRSLRGEVGWDWNMWPSSGITAVYL